MISSAACGVTVFWPVTSTKYDGAEDDEMPPDPTLLR